MGRACCGGALGFKLKKQLRLCLYTLAALYPLYLLYVYHASLFVAWLARGMLLRARHCLSLCGAGLWQAACLRMHISQRVSMRGCAVCLVLTGLVCADQGCCIDPLEADCAGFFMLHYRIPGFWEVGS